MSEFIPAGVDPAGLRNVLGTQINPGTEDTLASILAKLSGVLVTESHNALYAAYPTDSTEVYTYKMDGVTVATVTITYSDSTKTRFVSSVRS